MEQTSIAAADNHSAFADPAALKKRTLHDVLWIVLIGALVRCLAIVCFPSINHPDENFQFLEQAHRLAFGYGIKPWEFRDGIRSLLGPAILARVFAVVDYLGGGPQAYILAAHLLLAAFSLLPIAAAYRMGLRESRLHGLLAGLVLSTWFEIVYFSYRSLTEAIAANFLLLALSAASMPEGIKFSGRRLLGIGFCLGLCLMLRIHLLPGLLIIACVIGGLAIRDRWLPMTLGALIPILAFGASDWVTWGTPFHSQIAAIKINLLQGKASDYGVQPAYWFVTELGKTWAGVLPFVLGLVALRVRKSALWLAVAVAIIASHSLIPHKEYRFVYPAFACLIVIAALGTADLIRIVGKHEPATRQKQFAGIAIALWVTSSASLAFAPAFFDNWYRDSRSIKMFYWLYEQPKLCGLLLLDQPWWTTGGYAYLHRNIPIFSPGFGAGPALRAISSSAFNYVLLTRRAASVLPRQFSLDHCLGNGDADDLCLASREGACEADGFLHPLLEETGLGEVVHRSDDG